MAILHLAGAELGQADPPLPFWAFPWVGGLAVARYLLDHPAEVADRRVLDLASGSGLGAIVAARLGAASVEAVDVDPLSEAAVAVNARANRVSIPFRRTDLLDGVVPEIDVVLAGDVCYEETMAARMLGWLRRAADDGVRVLIGDPGRAYAPAGLERLATYRVRSTLELESSEVKDVGVFTFQAGPPRRGAAGHDENRVGRDRPV
jgi:predicted nicotinamide N-methyase